MGLTNAKMMSEHKKNLTLIRKNKVEIKPTKCADSRTAPNDLTKEQLKEASVNHSMEVQDMLAAMCQEMSVAGYMHDWSKCSDDGLDQFYKDMKESKETGVNFTTLSWYEYHVNHERHHFTVKEPDNVNLIDVMEFLADNVCAGIARSGKVREIKIPPELLEKAIQNTIELMKHYTKVVSEYSKS